MELLPDDEFTTPFPEAQEQEHNTNKAIMLRNIIMHTMIPFFTVIVAVDKNNGIGKDGKMPWNAPEDMAFFKDLTTKVTDPEKQNVIIMGRKTFESMNMRPLKSRFNICVSKTLKQEDFMHYTNVAIVECFEDALRLSVTVNCENAFVIGGSLLYNEAVWHGRCGKVICNEIAGDYDCDTFFTKLNPIMYSEPEITVISDKVTSTKYISNNYTYHLENSLKDNTTNNVASTN